LLDKVIIQLKKMWGLIILCSYLIQLSLCLQETPILGTQAYQPDLTDAVFWNDADESVYYTDYIATGNQSSIYRYSPSTNTTNGAYIPGYGQISYLVPVNNSQFQTSESLFLVGSEHDNVIISWDGIAEAAEVVEVLFSLEADIPTSHTDYGSQDPNGQIFVGTTQDAYCGATTANSSLYTYVDGNVIPVISGLTATTGLSFGSNGEIYHADVCTGLIREITKNSTGQYNARVVFDFNEQGYIYPAYITADTAGYLYIPLYNNGTFWKINPSTSTGEIIATLPVGATAASFGGEDRKTIFAVISSLEVNATTLAVVGESFGVALYNISDVDATGRTYANANV